ncbi:MAG TPA: SIMPL domain-containing protein [Gammaproteobacteria bacterium]
MLPYPALADDAPLTYDRVQLSGSATREVANDTLVAVLFVQREGQAAAPLAAEVNAAIAWGLEQARKADGVKVQTLGYQTNPVYQNNRISGWRVRQALRLESRDSERLSTLLGELQARLALQSVGYEVSPEARRAAEEALVREALAAFRARAELVSGELGAAGYRLVQLDVDGGGPPPRPYQAMAAMEMRAAAAPPALEAGTQDLSVTVRGTIELERR